MMVPVLIAAPCTNLNIRTQVIELARASKALLNVAIEQPINNGILRPNLSERGPITRPENATAIMYTPIDI